MNLRVMIGSVAALSLVGCSANRTVRQFDVPFSAASAKVGALYPSATYQPVAAKPETAKLAGPMASVRRDEMRAGQVTWLVSEGTADAVDRRTTIVLSKLPNSRSEVSVQTSKAKSDVMLPPRDQAYEAARMDEIAEAVRP